MSADSRHPQTVVYGPAYLDRVLRVDAPLTPGPRAHPLDRSVDALAVEPGPGLTLTDPLGRSIEVELPNGWPGPTGTVRLAAGLDDRDTPPWRHRVGSVGWRDDLGGMGAGYAAALGGALVSALGPPGDPISRSVGSLLDRHGIRHEPARLDQGTADWTLLLTSGPHGDKLPIGFRGCHDAWAARPDAARRGAYGTEHIRVVAGLPNALAGSLLRMSGADLRLFAPSRRNVAGPAALPPIAEFAGSTDLMSCNRGEWEAMPEDQRRAIARWCRIVVVTDGPRGAAISTSDESGQGSFSMGAFPRDRPPRDTNRAGECFAACLAGHLHRGGWNGRAEVVPRALLEAGLRRASAAAALVLDRLDFGFPTDDEIDAALAAGVVR